jgi:hypothetical protein
VPGIGWLGWWWPASEGDRYFSPDLLIEGDEQALSQFANLFREQSKMVGSSSLSRTEIEQQLKVSTKISLKLTSVPDRTSSRNVR